MTTPTYTNGSMGHWSGTEFNTKFHIAMPGWPAGFSKEELEDDSDMPMGFKMLSTPGSATPGHVFIKLALPNDRQGSEIEIYTCVTTGHQGFIRMRMPSKAELKAIRDNWWDIRDAALLDYDGMSKSEFLPMNALIESFAKVEPIFLCQKISVRKPDPDYEHYILSTTQIPTEPAPPLPTFPSSLPTPSELPTASTLQKELQAAIEDAEGSLACLGNGYAWAVQMVLADLEPVLSKHMPGFSLDDYRFSNDS